MSKFFRITMMAALALALGTLVAQAQGAKQFGVIGGVDFSSFGGSLSSGFFISDFTGTVVFDDQQSTTGFLGGILVNIPVGNRVSVEPELLYASKGAEYNATIFDEFDQYVGEGRLTANLDYLTIPVLLRYDFDSSGGPYLLAGPEVSISIACSLKGDGGSLDCSDDLGLETNTTFGGAVGIGYQKGPVGLEARYDFDFGNAFADIDGLKNQAWEILLRYHFR